MGPRQVPFSKVLYIEQDDFREVPPPKYYRLAPGREVRLRWGYFVRCTHVVKDPQTGEVIEVHCTYDPETRGGNAPDGRKVKATIHWVPDIRRGGVNRHVAEPGERWPVAKSPTFATPTSCDSSDGRLHLI